MEGFYIGGHYQPKNDAPEYQALHPKAKRSAPIDEHFGFASAGETEGLRVSN